MDKLSREAKIIIKSRLSFLIIIFSMLSFIPYHGYAKMSLMQQIKEKKVTLNIKSEPINEIFIEIKKQTGLNFIVNTQIVKTIGQKQITVKNVSVKEALNILLYDTGYIYEIRDNYVIIKKAGTSQVAIGKKIKIEGNVIDSDTKNPLEGVTIIDTHNDKIYAITDQQGRFSIIANEGSTLEVAFVGMETQFVEAVGGKILKISLVPDAIEIDDVIVTGYGTVKKSSWTGNATTVTKDQILKVSKTNLVQALQVFDPSFRIKENSRWGSDPNAIPEIYIRGESGMAQQELTDNLSKSNLKDNPNLPTFIMDGFEIDVEKLYDMDINRIETITILKDAAATALYGSRAANGVVVITTTMPRSEEVIVNYSFTGSVIAPDLTSYNLANAAEKLEIERKANVYESDFDMKKYYEKLSLVNRGVDTYWLSLPLKTAFNHNHSLSVEGGGGVLRYGLYLNLADVDGVMKGSERNNYGANFNVSYHNKNLTIRNSISYSQTNSHESNFGTFSDYSKALPYDEFVDEDGKYLKLLKYGRGTTPGQKLNPLYESTLGNYDKSKSDDITNNLSIEYRLPIGLWFSTQLSLAKTTNSNNRFLDPLSAKNNKSIQHYGSSGELYLTDNSGNRMSVNAFATYFKNLKKHDINARLGFEINTSNSKSINMSYEGFPSGSLSSVNYAQDIRVKPTSTSSINRLIGFLGSINYSYNNIYLLDASFRFDGSSVYGDNSRFAPLWSAGAGLNIHNYKALKESKVISMFKIRATYGSTGKINFPPHAAKTTYTVLNDEWYNTGYGAILMSMGNPNLKWETTNTFDAGAELGFFNNRITLRASYYHRKTVDLLNDVAIPKYSGFSTYKENVGEMLNEGMELSLYLSVIRKRDWTLNLSANLSRNKNKILKISEQLKEYNKMVQKFQEERDDSNRVRTVPFTQYVEGGSTSSIWGMMSCGIDPSTGLEIFKLPLGGYTDVWQSANQVVLGNTEPKAQGSFSLNFTYKNFTLSSSFMYQFGGDEYNTTLLNKIENAYLEYENVDKRVLTDRWSKPGDIAQFKRIDAYHTTQPTSRFVQRKNTLAGTSISISYELSSRFVNKINLRRMSFDVGTNDLFYLSTIKQERGLDFPYARTFNVSARISF